MGNTNNKIYKNVDLYEFDECGISPKSDKNIIKTNNIKKKNLKENLKENLKFKNINNSKIL